MSTSPTVPFALIPGQPDVEFRFTIKTARDFERAARPHGGIEAIRYRGGATEVTVMMTLYALRWKMPRLTDDQVVDMLQVFVDEGGNVSDLIMAIDKALTESGVYGRPEPKDAAGNPSTPAATMNPPAQMAMPVTT
jgi:hypothetical protein